MGLYVNFYLEIGSLHEAFFFFFFLKWVKEETSLIFKKLYKTTDQTKYDFSSELKVCDVIKVLILQKIIF